MKIKFAGKKGLGQTFQIDSDDWNRVSKHKWWIDRLGRPQTDICHKRVLLGRFITNPPDDMVVDHINGDIKDNRKSNLRICTRKQNQRNRTVLNKNSTSGYRGISWDKAREKWTAQLSLNYKHIYLGRFVDINDARRVVQEAIKKYHKEFSNLKNA